MVLADKVSVPPEQIGELLLAVGADGTALTVMVPVRTVPPQLFTVA